jgi:hypothetical protein
MRLPVSLALAATVAAIPGAARAQDPTARDSALGRLPRLVAGRTVRGMLT